MTRQRKKPTPGLSIFTFKDKSSSTGNSPTDDKVTDAEIKESIQAIELLLEDPKLSSSKREELVVRKNILEAKYQDLKNDETRLALSDLGMAF